MTDIFRKEYVPLADLQKSHVELIKIAAEDLYRRFNNAVESLNAERIIVADPRAMALAKTNLEQAVMWAIKGITG